jgi:hypothetical protein
MHIDPTLNIFSEVTTSLGKNVRDFEEKTCALFQTRELERERTARQCRQESANANAKRRPDAQERPAEKRPTATRGSTRKPKHLNLKTYKYHSLGDYIAAIRRFGTTDSYSTQPVRH